MHAVFVFYILFKKKIKTSMAGFLDNNSDEDLEFNINTSYAERYDNWRGKEELQKYTDRYGEAALAKLDNSSESSSSTEEDDDAKEVTPQFEKQFFKALSYLKKKDPKIYDPNTRFFEKKKIEEETINTKKNKKEKKLFLRDYERKMLLEKQGQVSSDEEPEVERSCSPTFVQEQRAIKQSFQAVLNEESSDDGETHGGLLKPRQKTKEEKAREEEDYIEWLKGQKEELANNEDADDLKHLKNYWNDPQLDKTEIFLRDYILNKRYLDDEDDEYIPTYDEVVHDSDEGGYSGDEHTVQEMEQFERKYNFRFEEPDQEFVKRYPRTTQSSIRQQDDKRRKHREEVRERKTKEKEAKRQQLKQLKAIKRKEISERIEKLKMVTGNTDIEFQTDDLNEDFDPEKHDERMSKLFDSEFYTAEVDEEKPEFPDLDAELELENWDQYQPEYEDGTVDNAYEPHCEDPDFNMDCEYDPQSELQKEMLAAQSDRKKKNRKRSKFAEMLSKKKPKYDPSEQEVDKYMDEYYRLDYEDIIGDMPCRFKYRNVVPNNYGLTIEEILMADDKELNRWCSLKKTSQYRNEQQELYDIHAYKKKAQLEELKRKILPSLFKTAHEDIENSADVRSKKKKKKRKNKIGNATKTEENIDQQAIQQDKKKCAKRPYGNDKSIKPEVDIPSDVPSRKKKKISPAVPTDSKTTFNKQKEESKNKYSNVHTENHEVLNRISVKCTDYNNKHIAKGDDISDSMLKNIVSKNNFSDNKREQHNKYKRKWNKFSDNNEKTSSKAKSDNSQSDPVSRMSDARLKAYGINPKKFKNKLKYGKKTV